VTQAPQRFVFVPRTGVDVDTDAGKVAGEGLSRDAEAIRKGCELVELYRILQTLARCMAARSGKLTFSSAATVASPRLPAHAADLAREAEA
jgi:hypothetical protein